MPDGAGDPISPQKERLTKALDTAFDEQVGALFKTLMIGLADAGSPGSSDTVEAVTARFARGMKLTLDARKRAAQIVETMGTA